MVWWFKPILVFRLAQAEQKGLNLKLYYYADAEGVSQLVNQLPSSAPADSEEALIEIV